MSACRLQDVTWRPPSRAEGIILRDLLDNNGSVTKDRLIRQLYGTNPPKGSRHTLNALLHNLRLKLKREWTLSRDHWRTVILREEQTMPG